MYGFERLLRQLVHSVQASLSAQVMDATREDFGAFIFPSHGMACADHTTGGSALGMMCWAYLADGSPLKKSPELYDRIRAGIRAARRLQRPTGLIDLPTVDFDSPPDTAFVVQLFCPVVEVARVAAAEGDERAGVIATELGAFVRTASEGIVGRGFRTPNHRWVVCSALTQAMRLFPDLSARAYVDKILAEGIDINDDGDYSERSSAIYNAVVNRSLRFLADATGKAELLALVSKNLDLLVYMLNPDATVVTSASRRQDHGARAVPTTMADSFFDMAMRFSNGVWASVADKLCRAELAGSALFWLVEPFLRRPEWRSEQLPRQPLPEDFTKWLPASGVWRQRHGKMSVTALRGSDKPLSVRYGSAELAAIRVMGSYLHHAQFAADEMHYESGRLILEMLGSKRRLPGWDLPVGKPVTFAEPMEYYRFADSGGRERWTLPPIDIVLEIQSQEDGLAIHIQTRGGVDRIPFNIEFLFEMPGEWETTTDIIEAQPGQTAWLKEGKGVFRVGSDAIEIGMGKCEHRLSRTGGGGPDPERFRAVVSLLSPVDHIVRIRCGQWSTAEDQIIPEADQLPLKQDWRLSQANLG